MIDCLKRQTEYTPQGERYRCLHRDADTYKQCVTDDICEACPLVVLRPLVETPQPILPEPKHGGQMFLENGEIVERTEDGQEFMLGDWVETQLTRIGITKEKWKEIKGDVGLPPTCNCDERQEWLNQIGHKFGQGLKKTFLRLWS